MIAQATGSPLEALECVRRGDPFDLAILDMHMPDLDGVTLAAELRKHRDAQALPLIMFSSLGQRETLDGIHLAASLTKPLKPSQLFDALAGIFAGHMPKTASPPGSKPQIDTHMA